MTGFTPVDESTSAFQAECLEDGEFDYVGTLECASNKLDEGEVCTSNSDCEKNKCVEKNESVRECWEVCPDEPEYECSHVPKWADCEEGDVCKDGHNCYKENDSHSQCRDKCKDKTWDCYVPPATGKWGDCTVTQNCQDYEGEDFDCFEQDATKWQCRTSCPQSWDCYEETVTPLWGDCTTTQKCVEGSECQKYDDSRSQCRTGECPVGWECHVEKATGKWGDCTTSQACANDGFTCYEKNVGEFTCMDKCKNKHWVCHVPTDTGKFGDCGVTQNCRDEGFECLEKCVGVDCTHQCRDSCPNDSTYTCYVEPLPGKWADCTTAQECLHKDIGWECFKKDDTFSQCRTSCSHKEWDCFEEQPASKWGDCTVSQECADDGFTCYQISDTEHQCRDKCNNIHWDCYEAPPQKCNHYSWDCPEGFENVDQRFKVSCEGQCEEVVDRDTCCQEKVFAKWEQGCTVGADDNCGDDLMCMRKKSNSVTQCRPDDKGCQSWGYECE